MSIHRRATKQSFGRSLAGRSTHPTEHYSHLGCVRFVGGLRKRVKTLRVREKNKFLFHRHLCRQRPAKCVEGFQFHF